MNNSKFRFRHGVAVNYAFFLCALAATPASAALAENKVAPLNYFLHSYGPASTPTMHLGWVFVALLVAIFVIIALLLVGAVLRKRPAEDPRAIGREDEGMLWIYIGTGVSTCILFALAIYTLITLNAIAHYLKSLPAHGEKASFKPDTPAVAMALSAMVTGEVERPGAGLYQSFCVKCHKVTGDGEPGKFPKLAGNSIVLSENATSLIRLLLEGSKTAQTRGGPEAQEMPGFAKKFSDRQIAEVLSFIRNSWGNAASPVTTREVSSLRHALQKKP